MAEKKPATTTTAPAPEKKEKKEKKDKLAKLTKNQRKHKASKIMAYLKNHPWQLQDEREHRHLRHLVPKKKKAVGAAKKVKGAEGEAKKEAKYAPKPKKAVPVPETVLARQKARLHRLVAARRAAREEQYKKACFRRVYIKRAQRYLSEYKAREKELINNRRIARRTGNFFREPDAKLVFVIRTKGIMCLTPRTRKILRLLRLPQINNGAFVRINKATSQMLRLVAPYVAYGYPNLATVKKLMYKRAYARLHGQRVPIVDNKIICAKLGKFNVLCMEDLIHQIYTVGRNFKQCNKFLWSFKLNNPRGGWTHKSSSYVEGGDGGNREEKINELIRRMI